MYKHDNTDMLTSTNHILDIYIELDICSYQRILISTYVNTDRSHSRPWCIVAADWTDM